MLQLEPQSQSQLLQRIGRAARTRALEMNETYWRKMVRIAGLPIVYGTMFLLTVILLSGCETGPARGHDICAGWAPIYLLNEEVDVLSRESVNAILSHNLIGQRQCGWLPGR